MFTRLPSLLPGKIICSLLVMNLNEAENLCVFRSRVLEWIKGIHGTQKLLTELSAKRSADEAD